MQVADLDYIYPPELVALEPSRPTRVLLAGAEPRELSLRGLLDLFQPGDVLVINESKVIPARIFNSQELEILFLKQTAPQEWQVLFPAREHKVGDAIPLPGGLSATLTAKGLPQTLRLSRDVDFTYFEQYGEVALPPYIQEARGERHNRDTDAQMYQTAWARNAGSVAAPTASLHFSAADIAALRAKGVRVETLTLHVGAGTFLPIKAKTLDEHSMHAEQVEIPRRTLDALKTGKVWALGTTVARSLEAYAAGDFSETAQGAFGETRIFIKPGFEFKIVQGLLTNFHQPRSTLLSLVAAFAGLETVKQNYAFAVANRFRLFSYGDLSVWNK